ncbi:MAG: hypothetical protein ACJ8I9_00810 [Chthoniobacterales bacterium]
MKLVVAFLLVVVATLHAQVKISFLPPPLEGTISLGIYDRDGKLVRVLHREAELAEFEVAADALRTTWDGKNESGAQMPPGKYTARGFAVGDLHVEQVSGGTSGTNKASVKLAANPLSGAKRQTLDLLAGFDEEGSFLQTTDGLPLFTVDEAQDIMSASLSQRGDKSLELCQNDGDTTDCFAVTGVDQIMAFDAGDFELK